MKRKKPCLSFDDDGGSGSDSEGQTARPAKWRSISQLTQVESSASEVLGEEVGEGQAQIAAMKRALGLRQPTAKVDDDEDAAPNARSPDPEEDDMDPGGGSSLPGEVPADVREVQTLSEFLRIIPALKRLVISMSADQIVATCQVAARLKMFDGELFDALYVQVSMKLRESIVSSACSLCEGQGQFDVEQVTSIASALLELNAYNAEVFSGAAAFLTPLVGQMSKALRLQWLKLLASAKHSADEAFEVALRTTDLPGGEAATADDFMICWDFRTGHCPRGSACRWGHSK